MGYTATERLPSWWWEPSREQRVGNIQIGAGPHGREKLGHRTKHKGDTWALSVEPGEGLGMTLPPNLQKCSSSWPICDAYHLGPGPKHLHPKPEQALGQS